MDKSMGLLEEEFPTTTADRLQDLGFSLETTTFEPEALTILAGFSPISVRKFVFTLPVPLFDELRKWQNF